MERPPRSVGRRTVEAVEAVAYLGCVWWLMLPEHGRARILDRMRRARRDVDHRVSVWQTLAHIRSLPER